MSKNRKPFVLLIRRNCMWHIWGEYRSMETAGDAYDAIRGRGITAWSWYGPRDIADKMLDDPSFDPDEEITTHTAKENQ